MAKQHAFLSASASHRWLECPPSAKLCSEQEDRASPYAQQGTACHELCAYLVEKVKCGTCGRAMSYKTYSFRGENYEYFGCPHAKEQVGDSSE